jgi:CheY-like chemotaxis protein
MGLQVTSTNVGPDAIKLLETKPDLLMTDLLGVNGMSILKALGPARPPVVVMTADQREAERAQAEYGEKITRFLLKPFSTGKLLEVLNGVLGGGLTLPEGMVCE